ncbi:Aldehyde dehydrogenase family [Popillia japonica]|uniref:Aldehyde dehydrogenase family n=1 Tax=Popillia japonica TaxID=7064 RepID=A0AAW1IVX2_POPJA
MSYLVCRYRVVSNYLHMASRSLHLLNEKAFINGEWDTASNQKTFEVKNPANGQVVGTVPDMNVDDVQKAIDAASEALKTWQKTTAKERSHILRKWYDLLNANSESIAKIMTAESGKPLIESNGEVVYGNSFVEWFSEEARRIRGETVPSPVPNRKLIIEKQPIGVVALITPWNFPHAMITRKAAAALAAGCTCVIKPAEDTPLTALTLAHLAQEAGVPKGVFNVVTCDRSNAAAVGKLLCESPQIAGISFTGSTQVGKLLYEQCARHIKRVGLELGSVHDISRGFLIQEDVFDEFVNKFGIAIKSIKLGDGFQEGITTGPLINIAQFNKVNSIVEDAKNKGAKIVVGGAPAKQLGELFYEPTLMTNIKEDMLIYKEEVFGPVAAIIKFKTEEEAVAIANNTERGLAGYFYSEDVSQIFRVSRELELGMVGINEGMISCAEAPFGGVKESGIGREGSHHGIEEYTYYKYLCVGNL